MKWSISSLVVLVVLASGTILGLILGYVNASVGDAFEAAVCIGSTFVLLGGLGLFLYWKKRAYRERTDVV
ncbi:MAG: hypothetical protein AAB534_00305 [Patescibacteria group bacterium]